MGFKRVMLNRLQIGNENKTIIAEMDDDNGGNNDGNRKHTDFSIDKILGENNNNEQRIGNGLQCSMAHNTADRLYHHINNEYYAYWNRRTYPPISAMQTHRSAFVPTSAISPNTATAHYEIMNLSLRMYDHSINIGDALEKMRQPYAAWAAAAAAAAAAATTTPTTSTKFYEPQMMLNNRNSTSNNNNNNNENQLNNNLTAPADGLAYYGNKFAVYQNLKGYGIDLTNLTTLNAQTNTSPTIKPEPMAGEMDDIANLACSVCGKVFENAIILDTHERTHKSPRYKCDECGKGFSQLRNYKYHVSVHKGTKEFAAKCPECDKLFNDKGYLSSHLKIHRNKKEYVCPNCPKSFNQRVAFNMHVRM